MALSFYVWFVIGQETKGCRGNSIFFGWCGLQALELTWIMSRQIDVRRRTITGYACCNGKIWIYVFPNKPITMQPTKIRMGLGKGSSKYWVSGFKPNRILYEICGVPEIVAKAAMKIATYKMLIHIQFVTFISDTKMNDG